MFINNKYKKIYDNLINKSFNRKIQGYTEKHHIIPRCMGGTDSITNIAVLTAREHYIAHLLLAKITTGEHKYKMYFALKWFFDYRNNKNNVKFNSKIYEEWRMAYSKAASERQKIHSVFVKNPLVGEKNHMFRIGKNHPLYGKQRTAEEKKKISENHVDVSGPNNPRARKIKVIFPDGNDQILFGELKKFCTEQNLPYQTVIVELRLNKKFNGKTAKWLFSYDD